MSEFSVLGRISGDNDDLARFTLGHDGVFDQQNLSLAKSGAAEAVATSCWASSIATASSEPLLIA